MAILSRFRQSKTAEVLSEIKVAGKDQPLIKIDSVVKNFSNAAGEFKVLKGIDAQFNKGEFIGVIGKSGSGKSTLINMITGIDHPTSGKVVIGGNDITELSENQMAEWRGKNLGVVFQFFQLLPTLSLLENIMLPMDFCGMYDPKERRKRAMELLDIVEMAEHADKLPSAISGGQQQRVAIARSLANDPPIIIADEPTGNLDSKTAESIFSMFEEMVSQGKTIVMVTHDTALSKRVSRTLLMADGEIVNEWVFKSLPTLSHQQMLLASHHLQSHQYSPGEEIIQKGQKSECLYILAEGEVDIELEKADGKMVTVTSLMPGNYFGEIELVKDENAVASVRAGKEPVTVYVLDRTVFLKLLSESEVTRKAIENVMRTRLNENQSATGDVA